jgi:hypothetical protein
MVAHFIIFMQPCFVWGKIKKRSDVELLNFKRLGKVRLKFGENMFAIFVPADLSNVIYTVKATKNDTLSHSG